LYLERRLPRVRNSEDTAVPAHRVRARETNRVNIVEVG
jgi:hypothetical protein